MSDNGVPIENIADLCGHSSTAVTEEVYRHQLKPVITKGAETTNTIFGGKSEKIRVTVAPRLAPHGPSRSKRGSGDAPEPLLTCFTTVGVAGFEPTTES